MKIKRSLLHAVLGLSLSTAAPVWAQDNVVWRIGSFDYSSGEFRGSHDVDYPNLKTNPVYVVGQSQDSQDWWRFQPGPANGMTGGRLHPFTIKFDLKNAPDGAYNLRVRILYETPRLSTLRLQVNGHSGMFYFHPKLDYKAGDWEGTFVPQTSVDEKTISIPAEFLKQGANEFVLTAIDSPADVQNSLGAIAPGHTGIVYDALEFSKAQKNVAKAFGATVEPTIFYRNSGQGLAEAVRVYTTAARVPQRGTVTLIVGGRTQQQEFVSEHEFGEQRFEFLVPEWQGSAKATVRMAGAGKTRQVSATVTPAKKWTVAIIPHEHLDVGFTDYAAKVAELHSQSIDAAMQLMEKTPDFTWTLDGSWVAEQYLASRSPEAQQRFLDHVRKGSIVIPPEYSNQHTGNASWEALARSLYTQYQLARKHNLPKSTAAQIVDVPSYTWGYASVLRDAGIKYFVAASNSWRAPIMLHGRWNEKSPFYWEGPDGGRVLMWYSRAYLQMHTLFGGPWRKEAVVDALPVFLQAYTRPDYTANTAIVFGSQLENTPLAKEQADIAGAWNAEYAYPRLEFSTVERAMTQIEKEWKGSFPVYRGDFGPYWEDGYGSDAKHTAIHRENQHRILTAEIMGTAVESLDPMVHPDRTMLEDAWRNELVYDEHTWTFVGATSQPEHQQSDDQIALKQSRVIRANNNIDESIQRGWAQLQAMVTPRDNSIAVFNSLNWARGGMVEIDLSDGLKIVDSISGKDVPFEVLWKGKGYALPGFGPGYRRVRFEARDVPPVGYKLYTLKAATGSPETTRAIEGTVMENAFYRVTLEPATGAVASIFDKELGKELVDTKSPHKFGSYLYVSGGDDIPNNSLYRYGAAQNAPQLTIHPAKNGKLVGIRKVPFGTIATLESSSVNTPRVRTEITLYDSEKKIEFAYELTKERVLARESAYVAFPFAGANPKFSYGSQTAWVDPASNELPGGSREWYLPTTWAAVNTDQVAAAIVPLDAPLVTFGDIMRGKWPTEFQPATSTVFSWLLNNYWGTNFPAWQGGDFKFRYLLTSAAKVDPVALTRFGMTALSPLERDAVIGAQTKSVLPADRATLLNIDSASARLLTWKLAEDGAGTIVRLQDITGQASTVTIGSEFLNIGKAWLCSALEETQSELPVVGGAVSVPLKPFQVVTIRVQTTPRNHAR
ncbi:MAG TPA: polysaccharide lyase family protein [Clostridia bacterium]|nr:polysaccharide lyase family protein [Clostridia bacterium]